MFKIITHVHTKYSHDSILSHYLLYKKCLHMGINYIAITEHNNIQGALAFKTYCDNRGGLLKVIIGEEIMTTEGEIIGLYIKDEISPAQTPEKTIDDIKEQGGIVYVPHPYDLKRYRTVLKEDAISRLKDRIDCIEVHNGRNILKEYDQRQNEIAEKYGIKKIIGADAHTIFEIGKNYMESDIAVDSAECFKKALDNMIFTPSGCKNWYHTLTKVDRGIKLVKQGAINELCRIILRKFKSR